MLIKDTLKNDPNDVAPVVSIDFVASFVSRSQDLKVQGRLILFSFCGSQFWSFL